MAARALLQRHGAPLTAALLAGGMGAVVLSPRAVYAEAPPSKKPIYDDFDDAASSTATLVPPPEVPNTINQQPNLAPDSKPIFTTAKPTPTDRLAAQIRGARLFLYRQASTAEDAVNAGLDRALNLEQSFTSTIASLAPPRESGERLMPGLIYVLVASMAGSIATRNRNILLRATGPVALGLGAAYALLPVTMGNVGALVWRFEQRVPAIADAHLRAQEGIARAWELTKVHSQIGVQKVDESLSSARDAVEGWVRKGK